MPGWGRSGSPRGGIEPTDGRETGTLSRPTEQPGRAGPPGWRAGRGALLRYLNRPVNGLSSDAAALLLGGITEVEHHYFSI